jgi:hypothetical protein
LGSPGSACVGPESFRGWQAAPTNVSECGRNLQCLCLLRTIEHRSGSPRVGTFAGAACCTTLGSGKIFREIMRWVRNSQKRLPSRRWARSSADWRPCRRSAAGRRQAGLSLPQSLVNCSYRCRSQTIVAALHTAQSVCYFSRVDFAEVRAENRNTFQVRYEVSILNCLRPITDLG